jgi:hypothetical protein
VTVKILAGPVVTHRRPWIGVPGSDLDVPQVHACIKHGRDESVPEHVRVRPRDPHPGGLGEAPQAAGGCVAVHPGAAAVKQDRSASAGADRRSMARPTAGGSGTRTTLVPLPHTRSTR